MPTDIRLKLRPADNTRLARLCGAIEANLREIEDALGVTIIRQDANFTLRGERARQAKTVLCALYEIAEHRELLLDDIQLALVERPAQGNATQTAPDAPVLMTRRSELHGRTPQQVVYLKAIQAHDVTFGIGPAGTGKTYLAVASAVDAFERDRVERIILTRPAVEAGERLGFLPGDLAQKVDPYLRPLYDALYDIMGFDRVGKLFERGAIEVAPLAFMRGRTLNNAFIILDEAQNTSPEQMKMFLTRIGFGSKVVVTGDLTQIDLPHGTVSGLAEARRVLEGVRGLAITEFSKEDVVRHPLIARIVEAYDKVTQARTNKQDRANGDPT